MEERKQPQTVETSARFAAWDIKEISQSLKKMTELLEQFIQQAQRPVQRQRQDDVPF